MANKFSFASVGPQALPLIAEIHHHLASVPVVFRFFHEEKSKQGKLVLASASKLSPVERHAYAEIIARNEEVPDWILCPEFESSGFLAEGFCISIYAETWLRMDPQKQVALLDHELCHCLAEEDPDTGEPKLSLVGHDIEEFYAVIQRHGDWKQEVSNIEAALRKSQLSLWTSEDLPDKAVKRHAK